MQKTALFTFTGCTPYVRLYYIRLCCFNGNCSPFIMAPKCKLDSSDICMSEWTLLSVIHSFCIWKGVLEYDICYGLILKIMLTISSFISNHFGTIYRPEKCVIVSGLCRFLVIQVILSKKYSYIEGNWTFLKTFHLSSKTSPLLDDRWNVFKKPTLSSCPQCNYFWIFSQAYLDLLWKRKERKGKVNYLSLWHSTPLHTTKCDLWSCLILPIPITTSENLSIFISATHLPPAFQNQYVNSHFCNLCKDNNHLSCISIFHTISTYITVFF